jgi:hypothetical protein
MANSPKSGTRANGAARKKSPTFAQWSKVFLAELATTSNVTASAKKAKVCTSQAYEARRARPEFNRAWQQALSEGYDNLEMELLHRLRSGEVKPASGAKRGVRSYDNANAFRLLAAHRESAARFRAIRSNQDAVDQRQAGTDAPAPPRRQQASDRSGARWRTMNSSTTLSSSPKRNGCANSKS